MNVWCCKTKSFKLKNYTVVAWSYFTSICYWCYFISFIDDKVFDCFSIFKESVGFLGLQLELFNHVKQERNWLPSIFCYQEYLSFLNKCPSGREQQLPKKVRDLVSRTTCFFFDKRFVLHGWFRVIIKAHTKMLLCLDRPLPDTTPETQGILPWLGIRQNYDGRNLFLMISIWYFDNAVVAKNLFTATVTPRNRIAWIGSASS